VEPIVITATRTGALDPIVISATRTGASGLSATALLVGSIVVIALLGWMVIARMRRDHQPQA